MADSDDSGSMGSVHVDWGRAKKYQEGFIYIKGPSSKEWKQYWVVIRGNVLFIFSSQKTTDRTSHIGTLPLNGETEIKNLPPEGRKKGFKFELTTSTNGAQKKCHKFKFDKENERDFWKSFIVGISKGQVPSDVHILPGQLQDVMGAINDLRNTPPPLPSLPRPSVVAANFGTNLNSSMFQTSPVPLMNTNISNGNDTTRSRTSNGSGHSGGSGSYDDGIPKEPAPLSPDMRRPSLPVVVTMNTGTGTVNNLRQLMKRPSEPAIMGFPADPPPPPASSVIREPIREPVQVQTYSLSPKVRTTSTSSETSIGSGPVTGSIFKRNDSIGSGTSQVSVHKHMFYSNPDRNNVVPSWFFEGSSRHDAEGILTIGKRFGNVLMRESTTFKTTGSYVISMRREVAGGTQINHYEVKKSPEGFKVNVDNPHRPMRSLSEVMDYFVSVAGPGTQPFRTNNRNEIGGAFMTTDRPTDRRRESEPEVFTWTNDSQPFRRKNSTSSQESYNRNSYGQQSSPGTPGQFMQNDRRLNVRGQVPAGIERHAMDLHNQWTSPRPGPHVTPPQSPGGYPADSVYQNEDAWQNSRARPSQPRNGIPAPPVFPDPSLNQTVPSKMIPSETLQRNTRGTSDMGQLYINQDDSGFSTPNPLAYHDHYTHADYYPSRGGLTADINNVPPTPPPIPPEGLPTFNTARPSPSQLQSNAGFSTTPTKSPGPISPFGGGGNSFEDELKRKLALQHDSLYASGVEIKKNF